MLKARSQQRRSFLEDAMMLGQVILTAAPYAIVFVLVAPTLFAIFDYWISR
jgi:hypothetical protein